MKTTQHRSWKTRTAALGLGLALVGGFSLAAAPAQAAPTHWVTGTVLGETGDGQAAALQGADVAPYAGATPIETAADGSFTVPFEDGSYEITVSATGYVTKTVPVEVAGGDVALGEVLLAMEPVESPTEPTPPVLPALTEGSVTITGQQSVGSTLSAVSTGWPEGITLNYSWGAVVPGQQNSGDIEGANASTFTVTADVVTKRILVFVTGSKEGYESVTAFATLAAPQQATAAAPVANSTDLAAYLAERESVPQAQTAAGLPAGTLDPTKGYTAKVPFSGGDSFVDVYLYSTPTLVGSFPVVNGVAQVTLSADVLSKVAAGPHTLVVVGQFSGDVSSVAISVAAVLASTGFDAAVPFGAAALLLLLGGALVLVNRRRLHA